MPEISYEDRDIAKWIFRGSGFVLEFGEIAMGGPLNFFLTAIPAFCLCRLLIETDTEIVNRIQAGVPRLWYIVRQQPAGLVLSF